MITTALRALPILSAEGDDVELLPPLYQRWLAELGIGPLPKERRATCSTCAMCPSDRTPSDRGTTFDPSVKCCTFMPNLANYLVGMILSDESDALRRGRESLRARIRDGSSASPTRVAMRNDYRLVYEAGNAFGRSPALRCPHYIDERGGFCGIWPYRNSICSTWFCKHVRGGAGQRMWRR